jgi:hypothetical protein
VKDVEYDSGSAYFVEEDRYRKFLDDTRQLNTDQVRYITIVYYQLFNNRSGPHMWVHTPRHHTSTH